jgi:hypothetical protein
MRFIMRLVVNRWVSAVFFVLVLLLAHGIAKAEVPPTVGYQGRLYNESNVPIDATLTVKFAIYPVATGGSPVWSEEQTIVFQNGYFAAELGSVTPFEATTFDGTVGFLGVTVGTDVEMTPRTSIASVPYALNAQNAVTAQSALNAQNATNAQSAQTAVTAGPDARFGNNTSLAASGSGTMCTLGEIILSAGAVANGVPAQGQLLQISTNTVMFALLGNTYGGDGQTTFALPDLRGAAPNGLTYSICMLGVFPARN